MSDLVNELQRHYGLLLGIQSPWQVKGVQLELADKRVKIELTWAAGAKGACRGLQHCLRPLTTKLSDPASLMVWIATEARGPGSLQRSG